MNESNVTPNLTPAKSATMGALLRKAGIPQTYEGTSRIGFTTYTKGFQIKALDYEHREVYGTRNGRRVVVRWNKRQAKNTRLLVEYHAWSTLSFNVTDADKAAGKELFERIITILKADGYVFEKIDASSRTAIVTGKAVN